MLIEAPSFHEFLDLRRSGMAQEDRRQPDHVAPTELCFSVGSVTINIPLLRSCYSAGAPRSIKL